ncbi:two-component system response regulator BtsR [Motilimonas sp. 1_MG-2023]|uniref:two-component system response regulator BtsR n=1 Tax=Motilimonas sp. 1_MG-2023 TaxID=3062672 RepID=UPI0026E31778|nr:two-component system response regulator BtsR [Motilimonas sp. 1_MG-2023]MDO6526432.1 two-component system response regulator BtsR [Motilimonas sp. 1_MG-2023]
MIRYLIIDDEPLARDELKHLLEQESEFEFVGEAANAIAGLSLINKLKPDLIFLDIQMPKITGLELASMLDDNQLPRIVFVTAYDEYAIKAFEKKAFDYILKPIEVSRLQQTLTRLKQDHTPKPMLFDDKPNLTVLPCYYHHTIKLIQLSEVEYVMSDHSGIHVITATGQSHTHLTLKTLEEKSALLRCHKQYLIAEQAIKEIQLHENASADIITPSGHKVPVSRRYLKAIKHHFGIQTG